jgi:hypothetical protein
MEMMMRTIKMERAVNNNEWIENEEKVKLKVDYYYLIQ